MYFELDLTMLSYNNNTACLECADQKLPKNSDIDQFVVTYLKLNNTICALPHRDTFNVA